MRDGEGCYQWEFCGTHLVTELPALLRQMLQSVTSFCFCDCWLIGHVSGEVEWISDLKALLFVGPIASLRTANMTYGYLYLIHYSPIWTQIMRFYTVTFYSISTVSFIGQIWFKDFLSSYFDRSLKAHFQGYSLSARGWPLKKSNIPARRALMMVKHRGTKSS